MNKTSEKKSKKPLKQCTQSPATTGLVVTYSKFSPKHLKKFCFYFLNLFSVIIFFSLSLFLFFLDFGFYCFYFSSFLRFSLRIFEVLVCTLHRKCVPSHPLSVFFLLLFSEFYRYNFRFRDFDVKVEDMTMNLLLAYLVYDCSGSIKLLLSSLHVVHDFFWCLCSCKSIEI